MRIKFVAPDPRAGFVAQMDSSRGQQLIDAGSAVRVKDGEPDVELAAEVVPPATDAADSSAEQSTEESSEVAETASAIKPRAAKKK